MRKSIYTKRFIKTNIKKAIQTNPYQSEISRVSLFGSYVSGKPRKNSDVDILIEFMPSAKVGFFKFVEIQESLRKQLGKKVDLLTPESLRKYFRDAVLKQAETIYEQR